MKKRIHKLAFLSAMALAAAVIVQTAFAVTEPNLPVGRQQLPDEQERARIKENYEKESLAKREAIKILDDREVIVRIYNDWQDEPNKFTLVPVRLTGLSASLDAVRAALPPGAKLFPSAIIVVVPADQRDKAVAAILGDFVHVVSCAQNESVGVWPDVFAAEPSGFWAFADALGNPIPDATVEILLFEPIIGRHWRVSLGKTRLDGRGWLKILKSGRSPWSFGFIISNPNYGTAAAEPYLESVGGPSPHKTYLAPLVPLDSQAGPGAISGFVVDEQGNSVSGVEIRCEMLQAPDIGQLPLDYGLTGFSVTDSRGWFAMYALVKKADRLSTELIPQGTKYQLAIAPPKSSQLRATMEVVLAGTEETIVLTAMDPNRHFYTFAFEDGNTPITGIDELRRITITHYRDGREWAVLKYDDWKDGEYLQSGGLRATTSRWGYPYSFEPIGLAPDSPEKLVFRASSPIVYKGKVVNGAAGEPMPNVLILVGHSRSDTDPSSMTKEQWERLRAEILADPNGLPSPSPLHNHWNRVAVTDANGCYQVTFIPGFSNGLSGFTALERGYDRYSISASHQPNRLGVEEVWPIVLTPTRPKRQKPTFVFEDESGPVTDPNLLREVRLNKGGWKFSYSEWLQQPVFTLGTYEATADWHGKLYIFEPVEVTDQSPDTIIFKVKETKRNDITYRGRVVHGITGAPMPGVIVVTRNAWSNCDVDVSALDRQQWQDIQSLGAQLDPNDPALLLLRDVFEFKKITCTGPDGCFQFTFGPKRIEDEEHIIALAENYLAAQQYLKYYYMVLEDNGPGRRRFEKKEFQPDHNNCVSLFPMKLFPAGTIILDPRIRSAAAYGNDEVRFHWYSSASDSSRLKTDLEASCDGPGSRLFYKYELQPNKVQTAYIPAGLPLTIRVYPMVNECGLANLGEIKLAQGQTLDLGQVHFPPTLKVLVRAADSKGRSVHGARIKCVDEKEGFTWALPPFTAEDGIAVVYVLPDSKGRFVIESFDPVSQQLLTESFPYQVTGTEDAGKEFTIQLSDEILQQLFKENKPQ